MAVSKHFVALASHRPGGAGKPIFPLTEQYHPDWILKNASGGANVLQLAEWLTSTMELRSGMRVLDLGCGRASSSIFLAREFNVQVWGVDLWCQATQNWQRICDAGLADRVVPIHADARSLPFAAEFFDAIVCLDALPYFGTDDLYMNYLAQFVRVGGQIGAAGAGLMQEIRGAVPAHLQGFWSPDLWCLHSADWWRDHWSRAGIVAVELSDSMPDGWEVWLDWHRALIPHPTPEKEALALDRGQYLGYHRIVARRLPGVKLEEACWPDTLRSMPPEPYERQPLLREPDSPPPGR